MQSYLRELNFREAAENPETDTPVNLYKVLADCQITRSKLESPLYTRAERVEALRKIERIELDVRAKIKSEAA